jgi:Fungal specific transcription factor domain
LAAIGAIEFAYMSNDQSVGGTAKPEMALVKPLNSQAYEHFLRFKQRALRQLSAEVSNPLTRIDDRTLAAIFVLILLNMIESGDTAWMYHLEGAKNILRGRLSGVNSLPVSGGIESFVIDSCLITEIMGSTLARPGVLSKPFYSPGMGTAVLKRLERTLWVGCPAYLLDAIFFVHAQRYSPPGQTAEYSLSFLSPSGEAIRPDSPLAILRHIDAFDPCAWAEDMQSYLALSDLSQRIALARAYKAAVYLYARRVVSKLTPTFPATTGAAGPLQDRRVVENELLWNLSFISPDDEHFKCLIWPTFIAGAESTSTEQRSTTLRLLGSLWNGFYSFNLQSAASVLKVMWDKQDERRQFFPSEDEDAEDEEGFDWIRELDQSSTDWLFI